MSVLKEPNGFLVDNLMITPQVKVCKWIVLDFPWPGSMAAFSHYFQTHPNFYQAQSVVNDWLVTFAQEIRGWSKDCMVRTQPFSCKFLLGSFTALTVVTG